MRTRNDNVEVEPGQWYGTYTPTKDGGEPFLALECVEVGNFRRLWLIGALVKLVLGEQVRKVGNGYFLAGRGPERAIMREVNKRGQEVGRWAVRPRSVQDKDYSPAEREALRQKSHAEARQQGDSNRQINAERAARVIEWATAHAAELRGKGGHSGVCTFKLDEAECFEEIAVRDMAHDLAVAGSIHPTKVTVEVPLWILADMADAAARAEREAV